MVEEKKNTTQVTVDSKSDSETSSLTSKSSKGYSAVSGLDDAFTGLSDNDADILRKQIDVPDASSSFIRLFRYANTKDQLILFSGVVFSILEGLMRPLMSVVFGRATQQFTDLPDGAMGAYFNGTFYGYNNTYIYFNETSKSWSVPVYNSTFDSDFDYQYEMGRDFMADISRLSLYLTYIGIAVTILTHLKSFVFIDRAEVLAARIKEEYLAATLRQNIGYFDKLGAGEITTRIASDTLLVQDAMSEKVSYVISHSTTFIAATIVAYTQSYLLSSMIIGNVITIILVSYFGSIYITKFSTKSQEGYAVGSSLAEESFSSVRNVQAFGIQERMAVAYDKFLEVSEKWSILAGYASGLMGGLTFLFAFGIDTLTYWQGTRLFTENEVSVGTMMTVIMTLFQGAFAFTIISPYLSNISTGLAASTKIFATIDRKSAIDSSSDEGARLSEVKGDIELKNVRFIYPSRPNVTVLRDFNLKIPAGKTVALVGASGSGKSTIVGILERFYNPLDGEVLLDGHDIRSLNIRWLRQNIALVSQEPSLFACSIFENICYGFIGTVYEFAPKDTKMELVIDACKQANAWDFIQDLPEKLDTSVGQRGYLMSGGQKQRIAIARAIVSNPKILLLDEATSALDTKSEGVVQEALDRASKNRTTIVIAHRLSTIKDADNIVVMRTGQILEQGTHSELIAKKGEYFGLVEAQSIEALKEKVEEADIPAEEEIVDEKVGIELATYGTNLHRTRTGYSLIEAEEEAAKPLASVSEVTRMLYSIGRRDLVVMLFGLLSGMLTGIAYLGLGLLYGVALQAFQTYGNPFSFEELKRRVYPVSGFLFMHGAVLMISCTVGGALFGYSSSRLVRRIRALSFRHFLRQDITYFDLDIHSVGSLTSSLASDAQSIETLGGATTNKMIEVMTIFFVGFILCVAIGYKLGLVMFVTIPIILVIGYFRFRFLSEFVEASKVANSESSTYACEATSSIRTVLSLTREEEILERYHANLDLIIKNNRMANFKSAMLDGMARGLQYFIMALGFYYGGLLVGQGEYNVFQFFVIFVIVVFGSEGVTTVFTFAPEMSKALMAGRSIKELFESEPIIDSWSKEGVVIPAEEVNGEIEFKDVHFRYPTRPEVKVLRGLNLKVKKGQFIALVGSSGCGKSTTIGLIESFYRPQKGKVLLDGHDVSTLNVTEYRNNIALVQQEPVLYSGSIKFNVALGSPNPVTDEQIESACRKANIHNFIMSLPDGYETLCGAKGSLLSGGQKQRIAIARALIREPKVLLLDEATSALDSESEKIVQAALDEAAKGRTTIAVAHRLSTIQNADVIYVFENGTVLESGTHQQLLANGGKYFDLVKLQALEQ
ncbi:P-loop containing nucleoside triphosphate hydrolase protein [Lipomyces arxii]|uniref:P-loop containing nucleoside triphosphate hydrolase protein n=1 Tax=Lipomyces arxii TaxID=56418 RepID=UPI0034CDEFED